MLCTKVSASESYKYHVVINGKGVPLNICMGNGATMGTSNTDLKQAMSLGYLKSGSNTIDIFVCTKPLCADKTKIGSTFTFNITGSPGSYTASPNTFTVNTGTVLDAPTCTGSATNLLGGIGK